jgi:hypothetical protein
MLSAVHERKIQARAQYQAENSQQHVMIQCVSSAPVQAAEMITILMKTDKISSDRLFRFTKN